MSQGRSRLIPVFFVAAVLTTTLITSWQIGRGNVQIVNALFVGLIVLAIVYIIFRQPYWGLGLIIATLPIIDTLPKLPYVTSLFPVIGAATIAAFIFERRRLGLSLFPRRVQLSYVFGLGFLLWIFITNPRAALQGGRGIALLTYFQLVVLLWLGGEMMVTVEGNRNIMWLYVAACVISASVALQNAAAGATFDTEGTGGLGGISSTARQFAVAFIFLFFLRTTVARFSMRVLILLTWIVQIVLLQGINVTGSRTGILIVVIGVVLILLSPTSKIRPQRVIIPAVIGFTIYFAVPAFYWDSIWNSIFPAIEEGSDTVGVRYELWATAMRMVQTYPIAGVGINQFIPNVLNYSDPLSSTVRVTGAHSIYFSVLAETGIIGFVLYMGMVIASLFYALRAAFRLQREREAFLAFTWFTVLVLLLVGGITKQDQYDKLLWFAMGACTAMEYLRLNKINQVTIGQAAPRRYGYPEPHTQ